MTATLDQRIDDLLGDDQAQGEACPVFLEMAEEMAGLVAESLRWALYGGREPAGGRRALLVVLDALTLALSTNSQHSTRRTL